MSSETRAINSDESRNLPQDPYKVYVSVRFLVVSLGCSILAAFAVGRAARIILLEGPRRALFAAHDDSSMFDRPDYHEGYETRRAKTLPPPRVQTGKQVPHTIYTAKNFDTARSVTSSSLLVRPSEDVETNDVEVCEEPAQVMEGEHLPAGQHLLVDIEGVDGTFLNSEERLAFAMVEVVNQANLTLLSYHCHSMIPTGVSCVGVLLESHISFHTWPGQGVITLDLFTCGSNPLLPCIPIIERLFGVPRPGADHPPHTIWSHKLRGFRPDEHGSPLQTFDLGTAILGVMTTDYKQEIVSIQTKYQKVDIYDVIYNRFNTLKRYKKSLSNDGSYESKHPELFKPERIVLLDGIAQSRSKGEEAYHEALVHPALFTHENPKRVAIIGGGEGATLREVLKHKTVETAIMIEIDEAMVQISRQYIPTWNDCSDLLGSTSCCLDDPRADIYYEDAMGWFIQRYGDDVKRKAELLDVIIMDLLDPQDNIEFADALYKDEGFLTSLYSALADDGILVIQVGESPKLQDPAEHLSRHKNRAFLISHLEKLGFESMHSYSDGNLGFFGVWNFLVATKKRSSRKLFYRNEAEIKVAMRQRLIRTKSGLPTLKVFDGTTMARYQRPSKRVETVFCRRVPIPIECTHEYLGRGYDPRRANTKMANFEVRISKAGEKAGRGVFAKIDIPAETYIGIDETPHSLYFPPSTHALINDMSEEIGSDMGVWFYETLQFYMFGYGFSRNFHGGDEVAVDSSLMTFANHGCNGTNNIGDESEFDEFTVDLDRIPEEFMMKGHSSVYNPVADRNLGHYVAGVEVSTRHIKAGEEILDNYLFFIGNSLDWAEDVQLLRDQCSNQQGIGDEPDVREYEDWYDKNGEEAEGEHDGEH